MVDRVAARCAEPEVAAQCRNHRTHALGRVASFGQTHEARSHMLGLDRRDHDRAIAEPPPKELPHDAQHGAPRPWRQPAHAIHVFVEAAQFFVDGRCTDRPRRDDAKRAQHHEQMADRRMRFVAVRARRPPAHAARQMLVDEAGGGNLVYLNQVEPFPLCPPEEMAGAVGVAVDGLSRMPALDQVPPERLNVWRVLGRRRQRPEGVRYDLSNPSWSP